MSTEYSQDMGQQVGLHNKFTSRSIQVLNLGTEEWEFKVTLSTLCKAGVNANTELFQSHIVPNRF